MAIHPLSLMSAPPAGPLPDYPRPPLCVTLSPRTARLCDWLWDIHVTLWVPTLWRQVCVYEIVKVCRKGEAGGGLLWLAYILAARNNSFIFLFLCPRISERRRTQHHICVYTTPIFQHHTQNITSNEEATRPTHPSAYQQWCQGEPQEFLCHGRRQGTRPGMSRYAGSYAVRLTSM